MYIPIPKITRIMCETGLQLLGEKQELRRLQASQEQMQSSEQKPSPTSDLYNGFKENCTALSICCRCRYKYGWPPSSILSQARHKLHAYLLVAYLRACLYLLCRLSNAFPFVTVLVPHISLFACTAVNACISYCLLP